MQYHPGMLGKYFRGSARFFGINTEKAKKIFIFFMQSRVFCAILYVK